MSVLFAGLRPAHVDRTKMQRAPACRRLSRAVPARPTRTPWLAAPNPTPMSPPVDPDRVTRPALRGGLLALAAALLFGLSTPLVQLFGHGVGAFSTAALLDAGADLVGAVSRSGAAREAALVRTALPRLLAVAACGAVAGPVALAWGLQRTGGASASPVLTHEAPLTALLAWRLYGEAQGARVRAAMALLAVGATRTGSVFAFAPFIGAEEECVGSEHLARPAADEAHERDDHEQRTRRRLAQHQAVDHLRRADPAMRLDRALDDVGQHGIGAAEGDARSPGEEPAPCVSVASRPWAWSRRSPCGTSAVTAGLRP